MKQEKILLAGPCSVPNFGFGAASMVVGFVSSSLESFPFLCHPVNFVCSLQHAQQAEQHVAEQILIGCCAMPWHLLLGLLLEIKPTVPWQWHAKKAARSKQNILKSYFLQEVGKKKILSFLIESCVRMHFLLIWNFRHFPESVWTMSVCPVVKSYYS